MVMHAYKHKTLKVRQEDCSKFDTSLNYGRKRLFHKTKQSITELVSAVHSLQSHAVSNVMWPLSARPTCPTPWVGLGNHNIHHQRREQRIAQAPSTKRVGNFLKQKD